MRHAKSSRKDGALTDHQRPLNRRGLQAAERIGRLLGCENLAPERIVTSTAERARQTAERVATTAGFTGELVLCDALYHATADTILRIVAGLEPNDSRVLLIGHNPGVQEVLYQLTGAYQPVVTGTLACLRLDIGGWSGVATAPARLVALWRPPELGENGI